MSDILGSLPLSSSKEKMLKVGTKKGNQWRKKTPKREKRKQTNLTGQQLTLKLWHALFCSINLLYSFLGPFIKGKELLQE